MSPENKHRIVGIIVLIAFIALLIPFLFTSGVKKQTQVAGENTPATSNLVGSSGEVLEEQQPLQTVTEQQAGVMQQPVSSAQQNIPPVAVAAHQEKPELSHEKDGQPILPSKNLGEQTTGADVVPPVSRKDAGAKESIVPKADTKSVNTVVEAPSENDDSAIAITGMEEKTKTSTKKAVSKKHVAVSKAKKAQLNRAKAYWSVQVGSFSDKERVKKMVTDLQSKGFHVYLQKINTSVGEMVRVLVGREASREKAAKISKQLHSTLGVGGRVVRNSK